MKKRPANKIAGWVPPAPADEREIVGYYEVSGLPVYEGDDYVTDVEGCYLTRAEANELLADDANKVPATTPFCARLTPCPNPTCQYKIKCDSQTLQPPRP